MTEVLSRDTLPAGAPGVSEYGGQRQLVPTQRQVEADRLRAELGLATSPAAKAPVEALAQDTHRADDVTPQDKVSKGRRWLAALDLRGIQGPKTPLLVLSFGMMIAGLGNGMLSIAAPEIQASFGTSVVGLATITAVTGTIVLILGLPLGYLVDRVSRVRLIQIGAFLTPIGSMAQATSGSMATFTAGQTSIAVSTIPSTAAQSPLIADYYRAGSRARVFGFLAMMGLVGGIATAPLLGWMVQAYGWRAATLVLSAIGLVGATTTFLLREPKRGSADRRDMGMSEEAIKHEPPPPSFTEALRGAWAIRSLRLQAIAGFVGSFSAPLSILLSLVLAAKFALGPFERSLLTTATIIATFPAIMIGTALADRLMAAKPASVVAMQAAAGFISAACMVGQAFSPNLVFFVVLSVLPAAVQSAIAPVNSAVMSMIVPARYRGVGMQVFTPFALVSTLLGPVLLSLAQGTNLQQAFLFFAPFMVLASLLYLASAGSVGSDIRAARAAAAAEEAVLADGDEAAGRILVCRDLQAKIDSVTIFDGIDLDIRRGELVALAGANGVGKTTLLRGICGLQPASNGAVFFRGRDVTHNSTSDLARRGLTFVAGGEGVFQGLTVRQNMLAARAAASAASEPLDDPVQVVVDTFPVLADRLDTLAGDLSGGEQQLVALAQAFVLDVQLLLIDELSLGLSPSALQDVLGVLRQMNDRGTTIVFVEQSLNVACAFADRVIYLDQGRVAFNGPGAELLARPGMIRSVFLGGGVSARRSGTRGTSRSSSAAASGPTLHADSLTVRYGGVQALSEVSVSVEAGEVVGVLGSNGAGKTTLFDVLSGYQPPVSGTVHLDGKDVTGLSPDARARLGLARAFQNARLFGPLTVMETIVLAHERQASKNPVAAAFWLPGQRTAESKLKERAYRLIETFGLLDYTDAFIQELSTGTRRAVEVACMVAREPRMILLDEPSSGLAQAEVEALGPALRRIVRDIGCGLLIIEHDLPLLCSVSDRLVVLDRGQVISTGSTDAVLADPIVRAGYLSASSDLVNRSGSGHVLKEETR